MVILKTNIDELVAIAVENNNNDIIGTVFYSKPIFLPPGMIGFGINSGEMNLDYSVIVLLATPTYTVTAEIKGTKDELSPDALIKELLESTPCKIVEVEKISFNGPLIWVEQF